MVNAINLARERGYVCSFGSLKLLMKELMGGEFKEGRYKDTSGRPFAKFKDFVIEAERRGKVQVFTRGTVNEVFLPGEDPFKLSQFAQEITEEPGAPVIQVGEMEVRPESRPSVVSNGRRRRRRSRGGQRGAGAPQQNGVEAFDDEDELYEDLSAAEAPADASEEVFEELLERVEAEAEEIEAITAYDPAGEELLPPEVAEPEPAPAEEPAIAAAEDVQPDETTASEDEAAASGQPFTDEEWQTLRQTVGAFDRPVPFAQIHDALRSMRNSAGITRTNEELRSLIKQAINTGVLERLGKGNRASYRLAQPAEESEQPTGNAELPTLVLPELSVMLAEEAIAEAEAEAVEAIAEIEPVAVKPKRQRRKAAAPAAEAPPVAEPAPAVAEVAEAPAKKPARRSRKAAAEQPAAEATVAETAPAEAPAAPKRSRRKKAAATTEE